MICELCGSTMRREARLQENPVRGIRYPLYTCTNPACGTTRGNLDEMVPMESGERERRMAEMRAMINGGRS